MSVQLEHANLAVRDIDGAVRFLRTAFPEFEVRREYVADGERWLHIGTAQTYIAFVEATRDPAETWVPYGGKPGLNHLGFEVDDVEAVGDRLRQAGYRESTYPNNHPHRRRLYFIDGEGNDWEFVEYFSTDPAERNDYDLPDNAS